jgi:hypothetical protein
VEEIFMAIYFPNLAVYSLVIVSTNICLFISLIKKQVQNEYKIANIFSTIILDFLFILILETIIKNDIDIYETLTIYSNKEMLVLIELSTAIYTAWIIVIGFIKLVDKTIGKEKVEEKLAMPIYEAPANNPYEINAEVQVPLTESTDYTNVFNIDQNYIDVINVEEQNNKNIFSLFNREKEETNDINITEEVIETTPMIENNIESIETSNISLEKEKYIKNFVSGFNDDETVIEEAVNLVENNVVIEENVDLSTLSQTDNNLLMQENIENNIQISNNEILSQQKSNEKKKFVKLFDKSLFNKKKEEEIIDYRVPLFETLNDDAIMNCIVPIQKEKIVPIGRQTINVEIDGKELLEKFNRGEKLDVEQYKILKDYIIKQGV